MRLPAIDTPTAATTQAQAWAYRIGTLPFGSTVEDVAMVVQAAIDEAVAALTARAEQAEQIIAGVHGALMDAGSVPVPAIHEPIDQAVREVVDALAAMTAERDAAVASANESEGQLAVLNAEMVTLHTQLGAEDDETVLDAVLRVQRTHEGAWQEANAENDRHIARITELESERDALQKQIDDFKALVVKTRDEVAANAVVWQAQRDADVAALTEARRVLDEVRMCAARGRSFGHQATPQTDVLMVIKKDAALGEILRFCSHAGITESPLRDDTALLAQEGGGQ